MSTITPAAAAATPGLNARAARWLGRAALAIGLFVAAQIIFRSESFPTNWDLNLADSVDDVQRWVQRNRTTHWLFTGILDPISDAMDWAITHVIDLLVDLPWFVLPLATFVAIARSGRWTSASIATLGVLYLGAVGLWTPSMQTLGLMIVAVALSVIIGMPLGILAGTSPRIERLLRPVLDAMQTIPATIYLVPAVLFLGIGTPPAALATVIFALPPAVRLTALGLQQVPTATTEAGHVFGSTRWQMLVKVRLPLARASIVTGINQCIMMALGIVVIASLVGGGGLGQEVIRTVRQRSPGRGFVVGFAIVAIALILDRVTRSFAEGQAMRVGGSAPRTNSWRRTGIIVGGLAAAIVIGRIGGWTEFPVSWDRSFADPIDDFVIWLRDHTGSVTRAFNDFLVRDVLIRVRDFLEFTIAWPVLIAVTALGAWWVKGWARGWKLALFCVIGLTLTGMTGLWSDSINTLTQVLIAVVFSIAIAIPIGMWIGRRPRIEQALSPVLDALQTVPSLIYAIPFVMLFTVGPVPGILASVLYAIPAGIRIAALGSRQVSAEALEASRTFGATNRQMLWGVRLPLAMPTLIVAVNQIIMMVMAMVVISGLVGGGALGFKSIEALTRTPGIGIEAGICLVVMAVILDRITGAVAERFTPPTAV